VSDVTPKRFRFVGNAVSGGDEVGVSSWEAESEYYL
jgi:hypothetical protein